MACKCQGCGRMYTIDLILPDDKWEKVKPEGKPEGAGLLCGGCIMLALERLEGYGGYFLKEDK